MRKTSNPNLPTTPAAGQKCSAGTCQRDAPRDSARAAARKVGSAAASRPSASLLTFDALALAPPTGRLAHLLAALDRRLHVVTSALQLSEDALGCHPTLEMFDGALDPLLANGDFKRLTLNCFAWIRQGVGDMTNTALTCKHIDTARSARQTPT